MKLIRFSFFTVFSEGVNSVGKVSFKSTFSIKDRGHPSILVTSLYEEEPAIFKKNYSGRPRKIGSERTSCLRHLLYTQQNILFLIGQWRMHKLTIGSCFSVLYRVMEHAGSLESTEEA